MGEVDVTTRTENSPMLLPAHKHDASLILDRLRNEHELDERESGGSFFGNRSVIIGAFKNDQLFVLSDKDPADHSEFSTCDPAFGFLVGDPTSGVIDILEIWREHRQQGIGRHAVEHFAELAEEEGAFGLEVECMPTSSEPFWRSAQFVNCDVKPEHSPRGIRLYRVIAPRSVSTKQSPSSESVDIELSRDGSRTAFRATVLANRIQADGLRCTRPLTVSSPERIDRIRVRKGEDTWLDLYEDDARDRGLDRQGPWYRISELKPSS